MKTENRPHGLATLVALGLLLAGGSGAIFASEPSEEDPKTAIGHLVPIGCQSHDPANEAGTCSGHCLRHHRGDSLALQAANGEVFILHGLHDADWTKALELAGSPVAVTGSFAWQGRSLRTLRVDAIEPVSAEEAAAAKSADPEYEMVTYYMTFLKPGPKQKTFDETQVRELMTGHFNHISTQAAAGTLLIAGPFGEQKPTRRLSGIYIYKVDSLEEAVELTNLDPTIGAGYFVAETVPWYGPKSLGF